ncbi:hypothetical protein RJ639_003915 [Escallonia herrerae]|uniref:SANT domain-containing protein n=1 Tax=Escallonia herrerae TaxID=1293975 RepID=A0AA89AX26_9ASTE|nr:hypothetical protein RJ639_003915 [Escallonia herrerae]
MFSTEGHVKQGGWHMFSEESGRGFMPARSVDKTVDEDRPSGSRGDGKYCRNDRENRGSVGQKDWKGHSCETAGSPNGPGRPFGVNGERSVDHMVTYNSHPHSEFVNTSDQFQFKDQHDKSGCVEGLGSVQRFERETSLGSVDWKPLKWTRSGSLSSRGSGFSHSSSSKSMGVDLIEAKVEVPHRRSATPTQSPSGDAAACVTSAAPPEEMGSRKKPRLGWGEGLAKYEKKKVEGPDDTSAKNEVVICINNAESMPSQVSVMADKSPRVIGFSDCASPATPSSVACSSSPGVEDKSFVKAENVDTDTSNLSASPGPVSQNHSEGFPFHLETSECTPVADLRSSLSDLLQSDALCSKDSGFMRSTAMNKLLVWKAEISKELEITESEIDLLENELKSLIPKSRGACPCPAASSSFPAGFSEKLCAPSSGLIPRPAPLELLSSGDTTVKKTVGCLEEEHSESKDDDVDSPGTATSKFVEPLSDGKAAPGLMKRGNCSWNAEASVSENLKLEYSACCVTVENPGVVSGSDGIQLAAMDRCGTLSTDVGVHCDKRDVAYGLILASNKDSANRASAVFSKLLPSSHHIDTSRVGGGLSHDSLISEKFAARKRYLKFKERVITLKFRAFQHLWKEDTRLLSIKRNRAKSQKRFELGSRTVHTSSQKHRSSIRSCFSTPVGKLSLVPTTEMINFTSKLLLDSQVHSFRSVLRMPALILDEKEKIVSRFISSNGLVEDPCAIEKERSMVNPWTSEEKEVFMDKLATFGKDFRKIASFLDHKTIADCVEFYYKNHKSDCFQKIKKKPESAKQGKSYSTNTYLVTSGKRWHREVNAASLDMLGAASAIAANVDDGVGIQQKSSSKFFYGMPSDYNKPRNEDGILERSSSLDIFSDERETAAADVLAGICGSLSSEAMSSCITSSVDHGEGYQELKCQKIASSTRRPLTPEATQSIDDETCSDESCGVLDSTDWTDNEKSLFIRAVSSYGKDFAMISKSVRTRSRDQCKVFFSKARKCLGLDIMRPRHENGGTPTSDDANGGGTDEDACIVEADSVVCSDNYASKMDEDLLLSDFKIKHDESDPARTLNSHPDLNQSEENIGAAEVDCKGTELRTENLVSDDSEAEDKPRPDFDGNCNTEKDGVSSGSLAVEVLDNSVKPSDTKATINGHVTSEETVSVQQANERDVHSITGTKVETDVVGEVSAVCHTAEIVGHEPLLPASSLADRQADSSGVNISGLSSFQGPSSVSASLLTDECLHASTLDCERTNQLQHLSGHSFVDRADSSQILRGYPVSVPTKNGMNGDISYRQPVSRQNLSKLERNLNSSRYRSQDCYLQKCNSSKHHDPVAELQFLPQEQVRDRLRPQPRSSSDEEKPCRSGDVKLFGQILTHPASQQKPNSCTQESEDMGAQQAKLSAKSFNLKFIGDRCVDGNSAQAKAGHGNHVGLENLSVRSYGFWDGNRIQTGFPSLPDSALLLAKYPAAFGNFPLSAPKLEQQPLNSAVRSNDHNVNGMSVFPARENCGSNGGADYQVYGSRDGRKVQPFSVDMKQRQDAIFSEMQRRSEIEAVSSMQQQARGMVGMNVVGRGGGILVGGPCAGVSDPVAAIKMHFSKNEQFGGQGRSIIREEESWRGNGDFGR